jgi:hypothetical protein
LKGIADVDKYFFLIVPLIRTKEEIRKIHFGCIFGHSNNNNNNNNNNETSKLGAG